MLGALGNGKQNCYGTNMRWDRGKEEEAHRRVSLKE